MGTTPAVEGGQMKSEQLLFLFFKRINFQFSDGPDLSSH